MNATVEKAKSPSKSRVTELWTPVLASAAEAQAKPAEASDFLVQPNAPRPKRNTSALSAQTDVLDVEAVVHSSVNEGVIALSNPASDWRRTLITLHVDKCRVWKFNPRHAISEDEILELGKLIRAQGQLDPIIVFLAEDGSGFYDILCGQRRWMAIKDGQIGDCMVTAIVAPQQLSFQEKFDLAAKTQENTVGLSDIDWGLTVVRLYNEGNTNVPAILGMSKSVCSKLRSLGSLPEKILIKMKENRDKFTAAMGYELEKYLQATNELATYDFVEQIIDKDFSLNVVRQKLGLQTGEITKKTRKSWTAEPLMREGVQLGLVKERTTTNELTIELRGISASGAEKVKEFILSLTSNHELMDTEIAKRVMAEAKEESKKSQLPKSANE